MKKLTALVLALCVVGTAAPAIVEYSPSSPLTASAASDYKLYEENCLEYRVYSDHAELYQYSIMSESGDIVVPDEVMGVPVTSIASYAFQDGGPVNTIVISDNVTAIADNAFNNLKFLTSVKLPQELKTIPDNAFYGCTSLTKIDIPESVTKIGSQAFNGCESLTEITIPSGVENVYHGTFKNCTGLTKVHLPEGLTWISANAFYGCSALEEIDLPDSLKGMEASVFSGCESLTSIRLPEGIKEIPASTFSGCSSLKAITIPDNVISIHETAFCRCTALEQITIFAPECLIYDDISTICNGYGRVGAVSDGYSFYYNGVIRGYEDSSARDYAEKYGYTFMPIYTGEPICGDANGDGAVNMADAVLIMQSVANPDKYGVNGKADGHITEQGMLNSDCFGGGDGVTGMDALAVQKYILKIIDLLPEI